MDDEHDLKELSALPGVSIDESLRDRTLRRSRQHFVDDHALAERPATRWLYHLSLDYLVPAALVGASVAYLMWAVGFCAALYGGA